MQLKLFCVYFIIFVQIVFGQNGFQFEGNKTKVVLPFKFINNLIIIQVQVNDVPLNFLLDTGVEESILFSLDDTDEVSFSKIEKIQIKGFGKKEAFEGYKSTLNEIKIKNYTDKNHTLYLVLDQDINISSNVGVPVNGIIGYHFFKNNLIKIDYESKRIVIYKNASKQINKLKRKFDKVPLQIFKGKPYLNSAVKFEKTSKSINAKVLIDTGNSDAVWLFKERSNQIKIPNITVEDYLGRGFSGDVFGSRGRVETFSINNFEIKQPIISFPNASETKEIDALENRLGSIGSEIMRRFTVYFDYKNEMMYLAKNEYFNDEFNFNMSGIDIEHQGLQWVQQSYEQKPSLANNLVNSNGDKIANNLRYKFELKPIYIISNIRPKSPADKAGIKKDDVLVKINNKNAYNFSLQSINELLKSEEGKFITITVDRNGKLYTFKIQLKKVI